MTKSVLLALALVGSASAAQALPNSLKLTCGQAAGLVQTRGAVVLATGRYTYDRFVAHQGYCALGEVAKPAWIPTRDVAQCFVGYTCAQDDRENGGNQ